MGSRSPNPNANIGCALIPGSPAEDPIQRAIMDYNNYSFPYPGKNQPDSVKINFISEEVRNRKANCLNKVLKTSSTLFDVLHYAAIQPGVNVSEINIGFLDYTNGETNSHSDGRACDIGSIIADGDEHTYTVDYDEKTGERLQPTRHESIGRFEEAFMKHGNSDVIWGPWFFHKRTGELETDFETNPNLIETYPEMIEKWPSETSVSGTKTKSSKQVFIEQYVKPFILYEVARNGYKAWKIENDEYELVEYDTTENQTKWNDIFYYHFQHRHHGHYAVKNL